MSQSKWVRAAFVVSGFYCLGVAGAGCNKEKDSLIVVSVIADSLAGDVTNLTLTAAGTTKVFSLTSGLSATGKVFGLYVSSDAIGDVTIDATASRTGSCLGYKGQGTANIAGPGVTTDPPSPVRLTRALLCNADGGQTTGTGGSLGTGGSGTGTGGNIGTGGGVGTGGSVGTGGGTGNCASTPAAGTPPQLACCTEYSHETNDNCAADVYVDSVAFSRDGTLLATGGADANVKIWSFDGRALTPLTVLALPHTSLNDAYGFLAFSPNGQYLAAGGGGAIEVYNVGSWTQASPPLAIGGTALGVGFSPDSQHIVSVDDGETLYVHVIGTPTAVATASLADYVDTLSVSPVPGPGGSTTIVVGGETPDYYGEAEIFSLSGSTLSVPILLDLSSAGGYGYYDDPIYSSAFRADGVSLALGDYVSEVWLTAVPSADTTLSTVSLVVDSTNYPDVRALAYSPANGNYLAVGSGVTEAGDYGVLSIWDLSALTPYARFVNLNATPQSLAFSPTGNALVLGEAGCGRVLLCTN